MRRPIQHFLGSTKPSTYRIEPSNIRVHIEKLAEAQSLAVHG